VRLTLHILEKDTRRLWWQIAVTFVLLAALARMDAERADFIPGPAEGWLTLLLLAAWGFLLALLVLEEPLVGDRQFWITRPYRWPALLAAKLVFAALFIHFPSLLADCAILAARSFSPLAYLPLLLRKQVYLAGALTLPAVTLAAVSKSLAQLVPVAVVVAGAAVILARWVEPFSAPWMGVDEVRRGLALLAFAVAAVAVLVLQYARRRTILSRALAGAALVLAAALFGFTPREDTFALQCALSPISAASRAPSIHLAPRSEEPPSGLRQVFSPKSVVTLAIPIEVSGIPDGVQARCEQLGLEIASPRGDLYRAAALSRYVRPQGNTFQASISPYDRNPAWQILRLDRSLYDRIKDERVKLTGKVGAVLYRGGEPAWMPVGSSVSAPGLGRCSNILSEDPLGEEMLKVVCESPSPIPLLARVRLVEPVAGTEWNQRLGDSMPNLYYPTRTWLSPLDRRQTFFHITDMPNPQAGSRWLVPRDALPAARLVVFPERAGGCRALTYEMADLRLRDFVVERAR